MAREIINLGTPDTGDGDNLRIGAGKINRNFAELYDSRGGLGPWEYLTFGAPISVFGKTLYPSDQTWAFAARHVLRTEGLVYRDMGTDCGIFIGNASNGCYNARSQLNSDHVLYRITGGGTETSITAQGVNASLEHDCQVDMALTVAKRTSTSNIFWGRFNGQRFPTANNIEDANVDLGATLTVYLQTDDITKCFVRARHVF